MALGKNLKSAGETSTEVSEVSSPLLKQDKEVVGSTKKTTWVESAELSRINHEVNESGKATSRSIFMAFQVLGEQYALPIEMVKEVVKIPKLAPLPQTPSYILGAGNIRGNILTIIDLKRKFNSTHAESNHESGFIVVVNSEEYRVGLLVESIPNTIAVDDSQVNTSASVVNNLSREDVFIKGIIKHNKDMIILIDVLEMLKE